MFNNPNVKGMFKIIFRFCYQVRQAKRLLVDTITKLSRKGLDLS